MSRRLPTPLVLACALLVAPSVLAAPAPAAATDTKPRLVVLELTAAGGVEPQLARALTEAVTGEVAARGFFSVVSSTDVQTLLGLERQRQLTGCAEDSSSCATELAGALGARFVLSGTLARLGNAYQLTLQTLDATRAQPVGRATRFASGLEALRAQLTYAVAEATGTPLPPPPSRVVPYSLMAGGGLAVVGGGVIGLQALARQAALDRELENGLQQPESMRPRAYYTDESRAIGRQKTLSVVVLGAGAALAGVGLWLNPPAVTPPAGPPAGVALVPGLGSVSLAGSF